MSTASSSDRYRLGLALLFMGALCDSSSGLFTRLISTDAWTTTFWRGVVSFLFVAAIVAFRYRGRTLQAFLGIGIAGLAVVFLNAAGMVSHIAALKLTSVANFFMIFAVAPFVAAILARMVLKEPLDPATLLAGLAGFCGIAIMMAGSARAGTLPGDLLALVVVFSYALSVMVVRKANVGDIIPMIALNVLVSGLMALPFATPASPTASDAFFLVLFGILQLGLGCIFIFSAAKRVPVGQMGLLGILNAGFAPMWVWLFLSEVPAKHTMIGGAIVIGAAGAHLLWQWRRPPAPVQAPA